MQKGVPGTKSQRPRAFRPRGRACVAGVFLVLLLLAPVRAGAVESRSLTLAGQGYRLVELDLAHDALELRWRDREGHAINSIEGLREWGARHGRTLEFATNAGIYDRALRPLGLHVEEGQTLRALNTTPGAARAGNFSLQPNGVFFVDRAGRAGVVTTERWHAHPVDARLASQSGPMLVIDGAINPAFDAGSTSLKWRSGVCAPEPGRVVFLVSDVPVSFHAFARAFRDGVGCRDALFLDGTLSRIWTPAEGYAGAPPVMVKPYAGMFAVFAPATPDD